MKKTILFLSMIILVIALAACGGQATPTPTPTAVLEQPTAVPPTAEPTVEPTAVPAEMPTAVPTAAPQILSVTGEISYADDMVLPDDAIVTVQIQNISLAGAVATVMGEQSYVTEGQQFPLPFTVEYESAAIVDTNSYGLSIRITAADDTLLFVNDTVIPVITRGNPTSDIMAEVILVNDPNAAMTMIDENTLVLSPNMVSLDTQGLPYSYQPVYVPEKPYDASMPPGPMGLPAHIEVLFGVTDPADRQPSDPIMYIIPVAAYEAMWTEAGSDGVTLTMAQIAKQTYLLPQPAALSGMPALPYEEVAGVNDLSVQVGRAVAPDQQTDAMATKNGYRFVGRWAQDANPVTNQNLRYVYQGFTNDGAYLVSFFYPVTTDQLPAESGDLSADEMTAFGNDPAAAITASAEMLNALSTAAWTPDLATLDALVASLQISDMAANGLANKTFQWMGDVVNPSSGNVTTTELNDTVFSLTFNADGTFNGVVDCNNTAGAITVTGGIIGAIAFQPGPSTAAFCGEESQDVVFQGLLAATQSYKVAPGGNQLTLSMPAGGGDYLFEAVPAKTAVVTDGSQMAGEEAGLPPEFIGVPWQWVGFSDAKDGAQDVPNPENYLLQLEADGRFLIQADCNSGSGVYSVAGSSISLVLGPLTRAFCGEDSLDAQYLQSLEAVVIWFTQDGDLYFDLKFDSGTMQFAPAEAVEMGAEAPATESSNAATEVPADAIQINVQGLAATYSWEVVPGVPAVPGFNGSGSPAYIMVTFDGATITETLDSNGPRIAIFPTEAYVNVAGDSVAAQIDRLDTLLALPAGETPAPESAMPLLPPPSGFMNRWVQYLNLGFTQGQGVRYISDSPYRQAFGVWANDTTGYYYQALTEDGRFYISLFWPVSTSALPNTAAEATEDAIAQATTPETNAAYQASIRELLNGLSAADWTPNLNDLDALAASIRFQP